MARNATLAHKEGHMDFTDITHGCLPTGTVTSLGTIEQVSCTAYRIGDDWVPFARLHGPYRMVTEPMVMCDDRLYRAS